MADLLTVRNVSKNFAHHTALDDVTLSVPEGSIYGLLGPNGAGKTTLIRIINQITGPDTGQILLRGSEMNPTMVSKLGYLPEERGLYKKMKVGEQALYLAQLKGLRKDEAGRRLKGWFEKFEIGGWWNKRVEELSKGMQQKVQFIVTVVHNPELLIFDEPFSGFDPINVNLIKDEILNLKNKGATIIFSTHNMASVEELCDHIGLIDRAKKILEGEVASIKNSYRSHTYEITYTLTNGTLQDLLGQDFEVLHEEQSEEKKVARINIPGDQLKKKLLKKLTDQTELYSFHEILPAINDIFIQKVRENLQHSNVQNGQD
jgi:ABC-2 type transport system ATP-binding protein